MMFGTRETFEYDECSACSSLQISAIPSLNTLSSHYPKNYYSFGNAHNVPTAGSIRSRTRDWLVATRDMASLGQTTALGSILERLWPVPNNGIFSVLRTAGLRSHHRLLDVGCGAGSLLHSLSKRGFRNSIGIDAFIDADTVTASGVPIRKRRLSEVQESFDFIMFNHSFEHVPYPRDELLAAHEKLLPAGRCLIRIPTPSSEAWETYGTDWVQLDAPRHLTLVSRKGITKLSEACGFSVVEVIDDSTGWSYMASELYRRGIPLQEQVLVAHFSLDLISEYEAKASAANEASQGDQAAFVLVKS
jgi:2-polyprenyl-3-methyl-5-hydroxy-6-metoxy-1,4-benzoquinol methylase